MPEINLLPDELRDKEEKELESIRKKPKRISIEMSSPQKEKIDQPLRAATPSLLSRLFARKTTPAKPLPAEPEAWAPKSEISAEKRAEEKVLHIPKTKPAQTKPSFGLSLPHWAGSKKTESKPQAIKTQGEAKGVSEIKLPLSKDEIKLEIAKPKEEKKKVKINLFKGFSLFGKRRKKDKEKDFDKKFDKIKFSKKEEGKKREEEKFIDVNLIPEELAKHPELDLSKKLFVGGMVIFICILLVALVYLGITWYQLRITQQIKEIEIEIAEVNKQISQLETTKTAALDLQNRLNLIRQLLDRHVYWTKFFDLLEKYTISDVYYTNFSMVGNDRLSISAIGKDYNSVAQQLVAFQNAADFVKNVRIDSASAEIDTAGGNYIGVSFSVYLEFVPGIFLDPIK